MTYIQPRLITAHAPTPGAGRSRGSQPAAGGGDSGGPVARWYHDAHGNVLPIGVSGTQGARGASSRTPKTPNGMLPKPATANGGHLVGPLGQDYEVRPGQSLSDIAAGMGVRHSDGMGGVGYTPMRVAHGWDPVTGKPVDRVVPDRAASRGMPTVDWNVGAADFRPGGSASPHALTFAPNNPDAAVRSLANTGGRGGGGGGRSGGFTTSDYAKMRAQADLQAERDNRLYEQSIDAAQRDRDLYDYKLTRKQRMELAAINDAIEEARSSGRFTPDEMEEIEEQALLHRAGIKPLPTPREKDAQKAFDERIVTAGGVRGYINSKGDFEPFQKDDGFANFLKVYPKLAEYTEDTTTTDPATGKTMVVPVTKTRTADEIAELVKGAQEAWNRAKPQDTVPGSAPTTSGIDPVIRQSLDPLGMMYNPDGAEQPAGPYAPPPPPTPEETRKKWSAFKAQ